MDLQQTVEDLRAMGLSDDEIVVWLTDMGAAFARVRRADEGGWDFVALGEGFETTIEQDGRQVHRQAVVGSQWVRRPPVAAFPTPRIRQAGHAPRRTAPRARARRARHVARSTSSSDSGSSGESGGDGDPPPPALLALRLLKLSLAQIRWCRRCGTFAFAIDAYQRAQLDALGFTTTCPSCKGRP